jgi:hypothetical protein
MPTPKLTADQIAQVSGLVSQYISTQREKYATRAIPLSVQQKTALKGFFSAEVLDGTRLLVLRRERVGNPDFYPMVPLGNSERTERAGIILSPKFILRCLFLSPHSSPPWVQLSVRVLISNSKISPSATKSTYFAARQGSVRN